jgi:hypothetical protein
MGFKLVLRQNLPSSKATCGDPCPVHFGIKFDQLLSRHKSFSFIDVAKFALAPCLAFPLPIEDRHMAVV